MQMLSKMWKTWSGRMVLSAAVVALIMAAVAIAAEPPAGGPGERPGGGPAMRPEGAPPQGGGQRGNRPQMNPEEMMKRQLDRIKTTLQMDDEKWKTVEPLVQKVTTLSTELRGGMGRRGQNPDQAPPVPTTEIGKCTDALRTLIGDAAATDDAIKAKLAELTAAKDKVKAALATARTDLCKALTAKQQANLVLMGILD
jgi:Spy/CpxP family protein refolding chaperone